MTVLYTVREAFGEPFTDVEQLRGRTIAMPTGSETGILARLFLSQAGVLDDVSIIDAPGEERTTLLDGAADVVTGMASDPPALENDGHQVDSLLVSEQFPVPGQALVTHAETLADRPGDIRRFLVGTMGGWVTARRSPADAARAVASRSNESVDDERRRFEVAMDGFADSSATRNHGWGWQTVTDWQRLVTAMDQTDAFGEVT
jgi:ABC-type nitrate/sulfonate/bicarbonate transport system substrate-binding protein